MSIETIIIVSGGLAFGLAAAIYTRWEGRRLDRSAPDYRDPAE